MNIVTLVNNFNCHGSILLMFPKKKQRKHCFLAACKIWDRSINLDEIDQKLPHGNSSKVFLARSKIFRLHAVLHDFAGAVNNDRRRTR